MSEEIDNEVINNEVDNEVPAESNESEVKARRLGWVPKEEFKGDESKWRDADEFLQRGEEIQGYLKADLERLHQTLSQRDREIVEIRQTMDEFRKFHNETEARAYKRAIEELKQLKVSAIEDGNGQKVVEIDEQIDMLKEAQQKPKAEAPKPSAQVNQEYVEWAQSNPWYAQDRELQELADDFGEIVKKSKPDLVGKAFLEEVTRRVRRAAPEKFENPNRNQSTVGSSSDNRSASTKRKKSYNDLPSEAKQACDRFVKQGLMTQEQYIKEYAWE